MQVLVLLCFLLLPSRIVEGFLEPFGLVVVNWPLDCLLVVLDVHRARVGRELITGVPELLAALSLLFPKVFLRLKWLLGRFSGTGIDVDGVYDEVLIATSELYFV